MIKSTDYFSLLSKLMSEDKLYNVKMDMDIEEMYNNIYTIIDTDFMMAIEKIGYPQKYEIVESLKSILTDYKLFLYFPELIYKPSVCLYDSPKCALSILKSYGLETEGNGLLSSEVWIPNDIPIIFTNREGSWNCLNIPDVGIALSDEEYSLIRNLSKKGINSRSLIAVLSATLPHINDHTAVSVIPHSSTSTIYSKAISNLAEAVVVENSSIDSLISDIKAGAFRYIKRIYCSSSVGTKRIQALSACVANAKVISYSNISELTRLLNNENYLCNNIGICERLTEMVNRIIMFLADNISLDKQHIEMINSDIFANADENAVKNIQELKSKIAIQIDTKIQLYRDLLKIREMVITFANKLEEMVNELYREITDTVEAEESLTSAVYHYPEVSMLQNLFLQYLSFLRIDDSKANKQAVSRYSQLLSDYSADYSLATEYCAKLYKKQKISKKNILNFINNTSVDAFIARIQIMLATEYLSYSNLDDIRSLTEKVPFILESLCSPAEYYVAGLYFENNVGDMHRAISYYTCSLERGNVYAGDKIIDISKKNNFSFSLNSLAHMLVPSACYEYGFTLLSSDPDDGIKYLKIAAAYRNAGAVLTLAEYYYKKVSYSVSVDDIYDEVFSDNCKKALSFYTAYDEITGADHCVECGFLCYYLENYSSAIEYLSRANDKECQNTLGIIYEKGLGCAVDRQTALSYYSNAKDMGSSAGAANYDRLSEIIAEENRRNVASTSTSYSSYSYYSYYSSYYSGYSSSSSGCVIEGTKILTANGTECNIEDIKAHQEIRNCKGSISYTSDELIKNDTVETLYAVNDDAPFMSLEHAILTERGWCSMNPALSMSINPNFLVHQLEIGDVFYKKVSVNGQITDIRCEITRINVSPNTAKKPCYDLHFFDGFNSYYANGYPCLLNYPEFTLSSLKRQIATMSEDQYNRFLNMCIENRDVLENIFGKTNIGFLFSDAIDNR
ncbi:MAG: sel1 repeat family protein [Prolixibacteraceae bacterium]|nr:sel1 repeat family protein [Prolixibacteraceae bacterium]